MFSPTVSVYLKEELLGVLDEDCELLVSTAALPRGVYNYEPDGNKWFERREEDGLYHSLDPSKDKYKRLSLLRLEGGEVEYYLTNE